jgi:hypothetical protein
MALSLVDNFIFGGVDSRSNPLNMPRNRSIRCINWIIAEGGWLELRKGYAQVTMSAVSATAIHSMDDYQLWAGSRYLLFGQGTSLKRMAMSDGTVTTLTSGLSSSSKWSAYHANNRIFLGNGTDMKSYDGTTLRDIGIRQPTTAEVASSFAAVEARSLTTAEMGAVTVTQTAAATSFPATHAGYQFYIATFSPASVIGGVGTGKVNGVAAVGTRTSSPAGTRFDFASLPNNAYKLVCRTVDGGDVPYVCTTSAGTAITSVSRAAGVMTVTTSSAHGIAAGTDGVVIAMTDSTDAVFFDGVYTVDTTPTATSFTVLVFNKETRSSSGGGTVATGILVALATTTYQLSSTSVLLPLSGTYGIPAVVTEGGTAGYQFYISYYNPTTGHIGNCQKVGARITYDTAPFVAFFYNLPDLVGLSSEWVKLIGRTADGGQIPYICTDYNGNFIYADNRQTNIAIVDSSIDTNRELPSHNGVPTGMDKFCRVGDRVFGNQPNSPYIYRSGSEADSRAGVFAGQPEESWHSSDVETFPTGQAVTSLQEYEYEAWAFTANDCAALSDLSGALLWRGPYAIGCAGQRAFVRTHYGPFLVTGDKQLATVGPQGPMIVSGEYEAALLSKIGDDYLSETEMAYYRDPSYNIDHIKIKAKDSDGDPFIVIHDFKLRDEQSMFGQAYECLYTGQLASDFTIAAIRNNSGTRRIWAGGANGRIYDLDSGASDDSTEFSADLISLQNFGNERIGLEAVEFQGDQNATVTILSDLNRALTDFPDELVTEEVPGWGTNYMYRAINLLPEVKHAYIRIQLDSHSADGSTALNSTPHVPIESYGRVWVARPALTNPRGSTT